MEKARDEAEKLRLEYENFKRNAEEDLKRKIARSEEEIEKQTLKARQILDSARASSEFIFRQLEDLRKTEDRDKRNEMMQAARDEMRKRMRESESMMAGIDIRDIAADENYKLPRPLKVGDKVFLTTINKEGVVTALEDKKGQIAVTSGILKTKVSVDKIRLLDGSVKYVSDTPKVSEGKVKKSIVSSFKPEIDVRGMIGDDAWFVVDKYIDDAVLAGMPTVRIIHGKGTGALRAALWKYFKHDKRIKSYRHGEYGEGDSGVTVLTLG